MTSKYFHWSHCPSFAQFQSNFHTTTLLWLHFKKDNWYSSFKSFSYYLQDKSNIPTLIKLSSCQDSFCLFAHLPLPQSEKAVVQLNWHDCIILFLPCSFAFLFSIHTMPWALSTSEFILIFQNCPERSLRWSPSALCKWLRHLSCAFHITNINTFPINDLYLSDSSLHKNAFWAKPVSSLVSRTYCCVKQNDY